MPWRKFKELEDAKLNCVSSFCDRVLIIGGYEVDDDGAGMSKASSCGLSVWRVLSGSPYYKQVTSYEDDVGIVSINKVYWTIYIYFLSFDLPSKALE